MSNSHPHCNVLGVAVSAIDLDSAVSLASRRIEAGNHGYVCLTGVHGVMEARADTAFRLILNRAAINAPDGMPLTWVGRLQGFRRMDRVFGPDFMAAMCRLSAERGYRNFLYGGCPGVAEVLRDNLVAKYPGLHVCGVYTPPFGSLTPQQECEIAAHIRASRPHILWVGLGTPRQEHFMARYLDRFQVPLLVGVGAAFDYHTGRIRDCSRWVKRAGLQWAHRAMQDPGRLCKRYLRNNPAFLWHIASQISGFRRYHLSDDFGDIGL